MSADYASEFIVKGGEKFDFSAYPTRVDRLGSKSKVRSLIKDNAKAIALLAHQLYGEAERSVLIVLQGMDTCLLYTSPSPRDRQKSRMPSSA